MARKKKTPAKGRQDERDEEGTVQTAVRLERSTYEWLKASRLGITDSIKRSIELVQLFDQADPVTQQLVLRIIEIARDVEIEVGAKWHEQNDAYHAFSRALTEIKTRPPDYVPFSPGNREMKTPFEERKNASHPTNNPYELAVLIANDVLFTNDRHLRDNMRKARRKSLDDIARLKQQPNHREDDNGQA
jgi:hypothetical protein